MNNSISLWNPSTSTFFSLTAGTATRTTAMERKTFTTQRSRSTWTASQRVCPTSRPPPQPQSALRPPSHRCSPTSLILKTSAWMVSRTMPQRCSASRRHLHSATSAPTTPTRCTRTRKPDTKPHIAVDVASMLPHRCFGFYHSRSAEAENAPRAVWIASLLHQCRSKCQGREGGKKRLFWQTSTSGHVRIEV